MTALPALPDDIAALPQPFTALRDQILDEVSESNKSLIYALLWKFDAANAESVLLQKSHIDLRGTISQEHLESGIDLPEWLDVFFRRDEGGAQAEQIVQRLWENYYSELLNIAESNNSRFLQGFAEFEIGLRNAVARFRAEQLGMDAENAQVIDGLNAHDYSAIVIKASEADDPQKREKILDQERLTAYLDLEGIDPFGIDAVMAYLAKAMVLDDWHPQEDLSDSTLVSWGL
jgi:vacuolar-type H+-ATPase subunit C/Vma6